MLTCDFVEIFHLSNEVYVVPPGKLDLQWVTQKCPQSQINWDTDCSLEKMSFPSVRDAGECYSGRPRVCRCTRLAAICVRA